MPRLTIKPPRPEAHRTDTESDDSDKQDTSAPMDPADPLGLLAWREAPTLSPSNYPPLVGSNALLSYNGYPRAHRQRPGQGSDSEISHLDLDVANGSHQQQGRHYQRHHHRDSPTPRDARPRASADNVHRSNPPSSQMFNDGRRLALGNYNQVTQTVQTAYLRREELESQRISSESAFVQDADRQRLTLVHRMRRQNQRTQTTQRVRATRETWPATGDIHNLGWGYGYHGYPSMLNYRLDFFDGITPVLPRSAADSPPGHASDSDSYRPRLHCTGISFNGIDPGLLRWKHENGP
ncbi:hypothetical protein N7532_003069 [Penicillium argentinense]|uniref:Uncharacterized protein n=1 Tax=Penicillium argentinense TaxID=1131581 RepID=A0A9W9KDK1_9EURO|nr:uncharacterized protein N7532_003069 [Penicillium argentinense]KAJ5102540.1 hypothetical protein N7532_003069 [Penicillium argentinense]